MTAERWRRTLRAVSRSLPGWAVGHDLRALDLRSRRARVIGRTLRTHQVSRTRGSSHA